MTRHDPSLCETLHPGKTCLDSAHNTIDALMARGGTAATGDEGLREPVLAWIDGVREWAEALKAAPEAATASSRGIGRDLTGHLSALRDITEGWDELGTAEVVSSLRTAALDATPAPTEDACGQQASGGKCVMPAGHDGPHGRVGQQ